MGTASWLATFLDQEMLEAVRGIPIAQRTVPIDDLRKTGQQVATELSGRYLLRYLRREQVGRYVRGTAEGQWVTPTPYTP